jgi:hypothetical protein
LMSIADMSKMELRVEFQHKAKFASDHVRAQHRSRFICALLAAVRKVPIDGPAGGGPFPGTAENPNYSMTVTEDFQKAAKAKWEEERDKKRLVPKNAPINAEIGVAVGGNAGSTGLQTPFGQVRSRMGGAGSHSDEFTTVSLHR